MRWLLPLLAVGCGKHASVEHRESTAAVVTITAVFPGASSEMVESAIAEQLEYGLGHVHGIAHLRTRIAGDQLTIVVEPEAEIDPFTLTREIHDAFGSIETQLPSEVMRPTILITAPRDRVVLRYTLRGATPIEIARWQDKVGDLALETVPGVARIASCGGASERWTIAVDPRALAARGKGVDTVIDALQRTTFDRVRSLADQLDAVPLIRDVATVTDGAVPDPCRAVDQTGPAVVISVSAQPGSDPVEVRVAVEKSLRELAARVPPAIQLAVLPRTRPIAFAIADVTPNALDHIRTILANVSGVGQLVIELGRSDATTADVHLVPAEGATAQTVEAQAIETLAREHLVVRDHSQTIVRIIGPDLGKLRDLAAVVAKAFDGHVTERLGLDETPHLDLAPDRAHLAELGLSAADLATVLRAATDDGFPLLTGIMGPLIVITVGSGAERFRDLAVTARDGTLVPVTSVAKLTEGTAPAVILRTDRQRWAGIRIAASPESIQAVIDKLAIPPGYAIKLAAAE